MYPLTHAALIDLPVQSPFAKFIVTWLSKKHGTDATRPFTRTGFVKALGLAPSQGLKPLDQLIHRGIIEVAQQYWHPGHPHYCFQLKPEMAWPDGYNELAWSPHQRRIGQFLENTALPSELHQHQLTAPQRVLLMVLLAYASPTGLASSITRQELARQTGMKNAKLTKECKNLKRYGYLRSTVSGGCFRSLIGNRGDSYFLELHHEAFGDAKSGGLTVITPTSIHPFALAHSNFQARQQKRNSGLPDNSLRRPSDDFFELAGGTLQRSEMHYLAWIIDRLAAETLKKPANLEGRPTTRLLRELYKKIANILQHAQDEEEPYTKMPRGYVRELKNAWKLDPSDEMPANFTIADGDRRSSAQAFLVLCVIQRAQTALRALRSAGAPEEEPSDYLILPPPKGSLSSRAMAIEVYPSDPDSKPHSTYALIPTKHLPYSIETEPEKQESIEAISESLSRQTSLRTPPLATPQLKKRTAKFGKQDT